MKMTHRGRIITDAQVQRGIEAREAWKNGQKPPLWVADTAAWDKAKTYALHSHSPESEIFWTLAAHRYEVEGGAIKATEPAANGDSAPIQARSIVSNVTGAPPVFMYMPGGLHAIRATKGGKPYSTKVLVDPAGAAALQASLEALKRERAPHSPWFDFNHSGDKASAHPQRFMWKDKPEPGIYVEAKWTPAGKAAVTAAEGEAPEYQGFSGTFYTEKLPDGTERISGLEFDGGGLVNSPAFRKIRPINSGEMPLWCSEPVEAAAPTLDALRQELEALCKEDARCNPTLTADGGVVCDVWIRDILLGEDGKPTAVVFSRGARLYKLGVVEKDGGGYALAEGEPEETYVTYTKEAPPVVAPVAAQEPVVEKKPEVIVGLTLGDAEYAITALGNGYYELDRPLHGRRLVDKTWLDALVQDEGAVLECGEKQVGAVAPVTATAPLTLTLGDAVYTLEALDGEYFQLDRPLHGRTIYNKAGLDALCEQDGAVMAGGPGSGSWDGPGRPRFARAESKNGKPTHKKIAWAGGPYQSGYISDFQHGKGEIGTAKYTALKPNGEELWSERRPMHRDTAERAGLITPQNPANPLAPYHYENFVEYKSPATGGRREGK